MHKATPKKVFVNELLRIHFPSPTRFYLPFKNSPQREMEVTFLLSHGSPSIDNPLTLATLSSIT